MLTRVPLVLASLVAAAVFAAACEPPPFPPSPDEPLLRPKKPAVSPFPQVGTIVALDGKEETIEYTVVVPVVVRERVPVRPLGNSVEEKWKEVVVYRWQHKQITRKSKLDRLKFFDASGEQVARLDAWKRLSVGTTFFVSADGNPVSAEHLKLMAKDALVVVDSDNVLMERIIQELELSAIDQGVEKPVLPHPGPNPKPVLPNLFPPRKLTPPVLPDPAPRLESR